ncbi:MAG: thiol reductant ABC exporter subunit CydC, partial [Jiangellaceae bacterium]
MATIERQATGSAHGPIRRVLTLLRPNIGRLIVAVVASVAAELAALALMATAAWLIARAAQQPPLAALSVAIVGVRAFATSRGLFRYVERLASHDAALRALATLRGRVYDALVPLAPSGLPAFRGADLLSRMVADVEAVQDLVVRVLVPVGTAVVVAGLAVGFVAAVLPSAAVILAIGLALAGVAVPMLAAKLARRTATQLAPARADLAAHTIDLVHGSADLAVFGAAEEALDAAHASGARLARIERRSGFASAGAGALAMLVQGMTTVSVMIVALDAGAAGDLSAVMVPVLALVALIAFEPVLPMVLAARHLAESRESARRVLAVLDTAPPVIEPDNPLPAPGRDATVEVRGLRVRHAPDRPPALDGVDLDIAPGRRIAIVGESGSGKSTLLAALMRFVEPEAGSITLNGHDLREYAGADVRGVLTGVTQDSHLFHTSIRENLRLARPDVTDDDLRAALATARLLDWVESLPRGLDTIVGEAGG